MNVALLHYSAPPIVGGVESVMRSHTGLMLAAGHKVKILAGRGSAFDRRAPVLQVPLLDSKHPDILAIGDELAAGVVSERFHATVRAMREQLASLLAGVDVVVAHNALTLHKNLPLTAALRDLATGGQRTPIVSWCHDLAWMNAQYTPALHGGEPWSLLKTRLEGVHYVVISQRRAEELRTLWGEGGAGGPELVEGSAGSAHDVIDVVPNGVDAAAFLRLSPVAQRLAATLRLWEQDLVLLLPARLTRRKNIEFAIRITASLVARGIAVRLIVTGPPGPHNVANRAYVQELDDLRRFLGVEQAAALIYLERDSASRPIRLSDRVVLDLYALSDALLFPSKQEGFGIPVLEAGLARLPAFCADIPPLRAVAGELGYFFDLDSSPDDVGDLIEEWMRSDRSLRLRKHVLKDFSWQIIYAELIEPLLVHVTRIRNGERTTH